MSRASAPAVRKPRKAKHAQEGTEHAKHDQHREEMQRRRALAKRASDIQQAIIAFTAELHRCNELPVQHLGLTKGKVHGSARTRAIASGMWLAQQAITNVHGYVLRLHDLHDAERLDSAAHVLRGGTLHESARVDHGRAAAALGHLSSIRDPRALAESAFAVLAVNFGQAFALIDTADTRALIACVHEVHRFDWDGVATIDQPTRERARRAYAKLAADVVWRAYRAAEAQKGDEKVFRFPMPGRSTRNKESRAKKPTRRELHRAFLKHVRA